MPPSHVLGFQGLPEAFSIFSLINIHSFFYLLVSPCIFM